MKAIIFDCFGVIISDALDVLVSEIAADDPAKARQIHDVIHAGNRGLYTPRESSGQVAELLGLPYEAFRKRIADGETKDHILLEYIRGLRSNYKTALLSNVGRGGLTRRFSDSELVEHFDVVVASSDIGYAKPDPEAYQITADRLGVLPEECIFVDDREWYCEAARYVGMQSIPYISFAEFRSALEQLLT